MENSKKIGDFYEKAFIALLCIVANKRSNVSNVEYCCFRPQGGRKTYKQIIRTKKVTAPTPAPAPSSKANVYLTFDDGPNKFTTTHNSILKKYNVNGTFFFRKAYERQ